MLEDFRIKSSNDIFSFYYYYILSLKQSNKKKTNAKIAINNDITIQGKKCLLLLTSNHICNLIVEEETILINWRVCLCATMHQLQLAVNDGSAQMVGGPRNTGSPEDRDDAVCSHLTPKIVIFPKMHGDDWSVPGRNEDKKNQPT